MDRRRYHPGTKKIKEKLRNLEKLPLPKEEDELYIETDASDKYWGAVLRRQGDNIILRYMSGTLEVQN